MSICRSMPKINQKLKDAHAFSLLEILVVLTITGTMMSIVSYGVIKFRQVITASNAAKEYVLYLRKARRYAINNVVTSDGYAPQGYIIRQTSGDTGFEWGEVGKSGASLFLAGPTSVRSDQYQGVTFKECISGSTKYRSIKFMAVTGEFVFVKSGAGEAALINAGPGYSSPDVKMDVTCTIEVYIENSFIQTKRVIEVNGTARTIKIK